MGLEPMTLRLKVWCSTDWANRAHAGKMRIHVKQGYKQQRRENALLFLFWTTLKINLNHPWAVAKNMKDMKLFFSSISYNIKNGQFALYPEKVSWFFLVFLRLTLTTLDRSRFSGGQVWTPHHHHHHHLHPTKHHHHQEISLLFS